MTPKKRPQITGDMSEEEQKKAGDMFTGDLVAAVTRLSKEYGMGPGLMGFTLQADVSGDDKGSACGLTFTHTIDANEKLIDLEVPQTIALAMTAATALRGLASRLNEVGKTVIKKAGGREAMEAVEALGAARDLRFKQKDKEIAKEMEGKLDEAVGEKRSGLSKLLRDLADKL